MQCQEAANIWKNLSPARTTFNCDHSFVYSSKVWTFFNGMLHCWHAKYLTISPIIITINPWKVINYFHILLSSYILYIHLWMHVHLFNLTRVIGRPNIDMQAMEKGITINIRLWSCICESCDSSSIQTIL